MADADEAAFVCEDDDRYSVAHAEFGEDPSDVGLNPNSSSTITSGRHSTNKDSGYRPAANTARGSCPTPSPSRLATPGQTRRSR